MEWLIKIGIMLAAGLIARHATRRLGRQLAAQSTIRIPALCSYATAGTLAGLFKLGLSAWTSLDQVLIWILFGTLWGVIVGTMLPFARKNQAVGR